MSGWRILAAVALLAGCAAAAPERPAPSRAPDPNGLLHAMQACLGEPGKPDCTAVDRARGFVIIKDDDPAKPRAWLIVPDREVTGIESPAVFRPPVADFWRYGWEAGAALLPGEPAADRALAINSQAGRSQNLLHIHISCVLPEVRDALAGAAIGPEWAARPFLRFGDDVYNVRKVAALEPEPVPAAGRAARRPRRHGRAVARGDRQRRRRLLPRHRFDRSRRGRRGRGPARRDVPLSQRYF